MKKVIYFLIAIAVLNSISMNASAEWTIIDKNAENTLYADKNTIQKRAKNSVRMSTMDDLVVPNKFRGDNYISILWVEEYDCKEVMHKIISSIFYEEHLGSGKVVVSFGPTVGWDPVIPKTTSGTLWKLACGMK